MMSKLYVGYSKLEIYGCTFFAEGLGPTLVFWGGEVGDLKENVREPSQPGRF